MATRSPALVALVPILFLLVLLPSTTAHNITRILEQFPEFTAFSGLLNRTGIANEINRRATVTVLAVENTALGGIYGLDPESTLKHALAVHVILDYYDPEKLHALRRRSTLLTTLFQTTGVAGNRMGFMNMTKLPDGRIAFGSATPGAGLVATYVKSVAARPYNISVLQVSGIIIPPGIDGAPVAPFTSPVPLVIPQPPEAAATGPSVDDTVADPPAEAEDAPTDSPSLSPAADAPEADSSLASPTSKVEDEDAVPWDAPTKKSAAAGRAVAAGSALGLAMGAALWLAL